MSYCETPNILRHVTMCDYTRGDMTGWFWERLIKSLQAPLNPLDICNDNPSSLSNLEMSIESKSAAFSSSSSQSVICSSPKSPQVETLGHPAARSAQTSKSECVPPKSAQVNVPSPATISWCGESGRSSSPAPFWGNGGEGSPHPDAGILIPLSTLPVSALSPSSPSTERKGMHKKKDLKSKIKSVFTSHGGHQ